MPNGRGYLNLFQVAYGILRIKDLNTSNPQRLATSMRHVHYGYIRAANTTMMFHTSARAEPSAKPELNGTGEETRLQIQRVLSSALFRHSQRCQALFRHITERALAGDTDSLKERALGVDVFGRAPDYDTNADPVVRGTAGEIRKKLAQYYQDPAHQGEPLIELRPGSYLPEFHAPAVAAVPPAARLSGWRVALIAATAAIVVIGPAVFLFAGAQQSDLDRFWAPTMNAPGGVLFSIGQSRVYSFRS